MKPRPRARRCPCRAPVLWAIDDEGLWVDVDPQATLDRTVAEPVVLWHLANLEQRVSPLAQFEEIHGPYAGPVWQLHLSTCPEMDRPAPGLSARGRRLMAILKGGRKRGRGGAAA